MYSHVPTCSIRRLVFDFTQIVIQDRLDDKYSQTKAGYPASLDKVIPADHTKRYTQYISPCHWLYTT